MSISPASLPESPLLSIPHDAMVEQKQGQAILIWTIGAFCIFCWEIIICLPREYQLVWNRPKNVSSVLYLANRYFGLVEFCFVVSLTSGVWAPSACSRIFYFEPVGGLISTVISQTILGGRVYAIFSQNKTIGFCLLAILVAEVIVGAIAISNIYPLPTSTSTRLATGFHPRCGVLNGPFGWLVTFWTVPLLFDSVTFLLTAWKAYDIWNEQMNIGAHGMFSIIWRDGLLYFFAIFSMNAVNVTLFLTTSKALKAINLMATLILQVILSCRLVLNLRASHTRLVSGPSRLNPYDSTKLRSVPLPGTSCGVKQPEVTIGNDRILSNATDSPTINYLPENKFSMLEEPWVGIEV